MRLGAQLAVTRGVNLPLAHIDDPELEELFDFDLDLLPEIDPIDVVLFQFLETSTGHGSFEARIALLVRLLEEHDETDDSFLPPAGLVVPVADLRALGARMLTLRARLNVRAEPLPDR